MRAPQPNAQPATVRVKVLRAFQDHRRETLKVNAEVELPRLFALEMRAANKVEILPERTQPPSPPQAEEKSKAPKKGESDAGK